MAMELTTEDFSKLVELYGESMATKALSDEEVLKDLIAHAKTEFDVTIAPDK